MQKHIQSFRSATAKRASRLAVAALLAATLAACAAPPAAPVSVQPQALALGLSLTEDGGLAPDSLQQANDMLRQQGRLSRQTLVVTPFNERAIPMAVRLGEALRQAGATLVEVAELPPLAPQDAALTQGWDLELRSEALALDQAECGPLKPGLNRYPLTSNPYWSMGPLGCANRHNLAQMVSDPRDLIQPKVLDAADGTVTAEAVRRYQEDDVKELIDIDFDE